LCDVGEGWRKISRTDRVKNEEVAYSKESRREISSYSKKNEG